MPKGQVMRKIKRFFCVRSNSQATSSTEANEFQGTEQNINSHEDGPLDGGGLNVEASVDVDDIGIEDVPHDPHIDTRLVAGSAINQARQAQDSRRTLGPRMKDAVDTIDPEMGTIKSVYELGKPVLEKVKVFADLINTIGQIHPYAKMATTVFLAGVDVVITQVERDEALEELFEVMDDAYAFVNRADDLRDMDEDRKKLLIAMSLQTIECAYFIRDHEKIKNFWIRAAVNMIGGSRIDDKIKEFTQTFRDIRRCFAERSTLSCEIRMVRILELGLDMQTTLDLLNLNYIRSAGLDSSRGCLPGTREETLDEILAWINDPKPDASRVRFLLGGAGTGKSSIAHSIGAYFQVLKRLGSFIRFDRSSQNDRPLKQVIPTIARHLGNWDPAFRRALAEVIHNDRDLEDSVDMAQQWKGLIVDPLKKVTLIGPVIVVIDAFDECSPDGLDRSQLLKHLTEGAEQLPPNFHILITSRPDHDVKRVVDRRENGRTHISSMILDDKREEAMWDVKALICHLLTPKDPDENPLDDADIQLLADKSEGLFQWAATACRLILEKPGGRTLKERLTSRLGLLLERGTSSLDALYRGILQGLFDSGEKAVMERFQLVMSLVLCASYPLSIDSLEELRRLATGVKEDEVTLILRDMGSLLCGVYTHTSPIHPHHTSFRDFLTDKSRSLEWFVDLAAGHAMMAMGCFRLMNIILRFNICGLETSYLPNRHIPDLDTRISKFVSQDLAYATCNWRDHLAVAASSDLSTELDRFLREKLLFWFELLSLLRCANRAAPSLETAQQLYKDTLSTSSKELLRDAISFARYFVGVMAHTASHVYLSALAFSPTASRVRANYLPYFPWLPIVNGLHDHWPQAQAVLSGHTKDVYRVAYSPNSRLIASGSTDGSVRIWDAQTGETIHKLSCRSAVSGVAFSPDGLHIVTSLMSGTVSIWDSTTWKIVQQSSSDSKMCSVVYSRDGSFVVAGDDHGRIYVWSVDTFEVIHHLFHGEQPIICIAISSCGRYIVSGSYDNTVRLSSIVEGKAIGAHLEGHTHGVSSIIFSLDGCRIVTGSFDSTIRIWDLETKTLLNTIAVLDEVLSLSLSPDGRRIVGGLRDGRVLIWNAETYETVAGPFSGHTSFVTSVDFAPDGRHVVSGSFDKTVRIWSTEDISENFSSSQSNSTVNTLAFSPDGSRLITGGVDGTIDVRDADAGKSICSWKGHSSQVNSITFSPDGSHFVSASSDFTLRVWNSTTLQPHGEPLRGHSNWVRDVDYSPDGSHIISGSQDHTLRIWDADTSECVLGPLKGHSNWVLCVAWSPDGKHIVSGSKDRTALVWDAEIGCVLGEPFRSHENWILSVSWAEDGHSVMSSDIDDTIFVWDLETRIPIGQPLDAGWRSKYSPDNQWILSGKTNGRMQLWDAQTRERIGASLDNPFGAIWQLAFSPDGRRIASANTDRNLSVVWDVKTFTDPLGTHLSITNLISAPTNTVQHLPNVSPDGWVDADGDLMIWVPDEYRTSLVWSGMVFTIPEQDSLTIDLSHARYGTDWAGCYQEYHT